MEVQPGFQRHLLWVYIPPILKIYAIAVWQVLFFGVV